MTNKQMEEKLTELAHKDPFIPFEVELTNGQTLTVPHAPAFDENGAGFISTEGVLTDFWFKDVKAIRVYRPETIS